MTQIYTDPTNRQHGIRMGTGRIVVAFGAPMRATSYPEPRIAGCFTGFEVIAGCPLVGSLRAGMWLLLSCFRSAESIKTGCEREFSLPKSINVSTRGSDWVGLEEESRI